MAVTDGEGFLEEDPAGVGGARMLADLVSKSNTAFDLSALPTIVKRVVGGACTPNQAVGEGIAGVGIDGGEVADCRTGSSVLGDAVVRQGDVGGHFVDIGDADGERLLTKDRRRRLPTR
jgi:hypothetical protein